MSYRFSFTPGTEQTDAEHVLHTEDGRPPRIAVQDCRSYGGGFAVNVYHPSIEDLEEVTHYDGFPTLEAAKIRAVELSRQ